MSLMTDLSAVIGTGLAVGLAVTGAALYVIRAENAKQNQPLTSAVTRLEETVRENTETMRQQKVDEHERHKDTQEAIGAIRDVLGDHEARLRVQEANRQPAPRITPRKRA